MNTKVTTMICGCCTEPIVQIPADWHTARLIARGEIKVPRYPLDRCDACRGHDVYDDPCVFAEFERPRCRCGCAD